MPYEDNIDEEDERLPAFAASTSMWTDFKLSAFYSYNDARKRPRNTAIGFAATFIVVLVTGLILMGMSKSRVVFLRFAELTTGEMDALILAEGSVPFVNYTDIEPKLKLSERTEGTTPRWLIKGEYGKYSTRTLPPNTTLPETTTNVLVVDSEREKMLGVGRAYKYRQLGFGEIQVLESILKFTGLRENIGDRSKLFIDIAGILEQQSVEIGTVTAPGVNATANGTTLNDAIADFVDANPTVNIPGIGDVDTEALLGLNATVNASADAVNAIVDATNGAAPLSLFDVLAPEIRFVVADGFSGPLGKYPGTLGNMVIFDYKTFLEQVLEQTCYETLRNPLRTVAGDTIAVPTVLPSTDEIEDTFGLDQYVLVLVAMLKDRFNTYYKNTKNRDKDMILWSNDLFYAVGIDFGGSAQYPIAIAMVGFDNFALFLNSIFFVAVAVIITMGALLVYTLLLTNSEERGFEVAMLRAQGMRKRQLFVLMMLQMTMFVVPGLIAAMAVLMGINAATEAALTLFTYAPPSYGRVAWYVIAVPLTIGIVVPLVGNAGPIRSALSQSLRDALDVYRNKANETTVIATRLAELGMDPLVLMLAWLLVIVGFLVYYMIPLAFIFNELWLFFLVMNIILLLMLFGLCLITGVLQVFLERGFLWLLLWGKEKRLQPLITKNFQAHSERNSKGYMMFTLSVACIVFGGVLFTLLSNSIVETVNVLTGADVVVQSLQFDFPLNKSGLDAFLAQYPDKVQAWSFETFPLFSYPQISDQTVIGNSIGFPSATQDFVALEQNFLDAAFGRYVLIEEKEDQYGYDKSQTGALDIVKSLYVNPPVQAVTPVGPIFTGFPPNETRPAVEGKYSLIMPSISASSATDRIGLTAGSFATLQFEYEMGQGQRKQEVGTRYLANSRALCRKFPGFLTISPIRFTFPLAPTFITVDAFSAMLRSNEIDFPSEIGNDDYNYHDEDASTQVEYRKLYVRLNEAMSKDEREFFVNLLQSQVNPYYHLTTDTKSVTDSVKVAGDMIMIFFYFVSIIAIVLDTLMLWLVFVSNVQLNSWSFAVLRSLGFTTWQLRRAFMYESLSIVLSSFVMGTLIGVSIAMTLVLQLNLFLQLPFRFDFPYILFFTLFALSLISAAIAPLMPANAIAKRAIAGVLKGG